MTAKASRGETFASLLTSSGSAALCQGEAENGKRACKDSKARDLFRRAWRFLPALCLRMVMTLSSVQISAICDPPYLSSRTIN
jgi:hypothetical protein